MGNNDRKINFELFRQSFVGKDFEVLSGLNPCVIRYGNQRIFVYIKNLTPAQLSNNNPDVWRCQLPKKPIFDDIKQSSELFLLLGYDITNDVYTTWNPYWSKQRLNIGESISMYSRYSVQKESAEENKFIKQELNHGGFVVVFPRLRLSEYLDNISVYFAEETEYKAIGSSLRKTKQSKDVCDMKEELFSYFANEDRLLDFEKYLENISITEHTKKSYIRYIAFVYEHKFLEKHKNIFLKYDSLQDYDKAVCEFCQTPEIAYIDRREKGGWRGAIRAAMNYYYKAICCTSNVSPMQKQNSEESETDKTEPPKQSTSLPELIPLELAKKIAPFMCQEEPLELSALQLLSDYYGDTLEDSMQFMDWVNLIRSVDWNLYLQ